MLLAALVQQPTVAVTFAPDQPAVVMSRAEAQAQFTALCFAEAVELSFDNDNVRIALRLSDAERLLSDPQAKIDSGIAVLIRKVPIAAVTEKDVQAAAIKALHDRDAKLKALAIALNPMPDWPQFVMNNDASVCNRSPKLITPVK